MHYSLEALENLPRDRLLVLQDVRRWKTTQFGGTSFDPRRLEMMGWTRQFETSHHRYSKRRRGKLQIFGDLPGVYLYGYDCWGDWDPVHRDDIVWLTEHYWEKYRRVGRLLQIAK